MFKKIVQLLLLIFAVTLSVLFLVKIVDLNVIVLIPIVILAMLDFFIQWFAEREFIKSTNFFELLSRQAHPFARRVWSFAQKLILLLILSFFGISFLSSFMEVNGLTDRIILYKGAIFVGGVSVILLGISMNLKMIFGKEYDIITNKKFKFIINIPTLWIEEKNSEDNNIIIYNELMSDKACIIFIGEKSQYHSSTTLNDYIQLQNEQFELLDNIIIEDNKILSNDIKKNITSCTVYIKKKKYICYRYFEASSENFYEVRLIALNKNFNKEEFEYMIDKFSSTI